MTTNTDIKPCPFCGEAANIESVEDTEKGGYVYVIGCGDCCYDLMSGPIGIGWYKTTNEAINAWNERYE